MAKYTPLVVRLETIEDPRHQDHVVYLLPEVLFIVYASILSGYTQWKSMASFAENNARKMGPFPENQHVIALDGKALRGSGAAKHKKMVHIVSAYCSELRLVLGIEPVDKKSNEITAIPKILDKLVLEGSLITIDAIGCQKAICQKILDKKADYLLCAKENQPTLCHNIEAVFQEHLNQHPADPKSENSSPFLQKPLKKAVLAAARNHWGTEKGTIGSWMLVLERMLLKCITVLPPKTLLQLGAVFSMLTVCVIFSPRRVSYSP